MEEEATRREQISYACSAQNPKLLPPPPKTKSKEQPKVTSIVPGLFQQFRNKK